MPIEIAFFESGLVREAHTSDEAVRIIRSHSSSQNETIGIIDNILHSDWVGCLKDIPAIFIH